MSALRRRRRPDDPRHRTAAAAERRRLLLTGLGFLLVLLTGFLGYQMVEGVDPLDSLYMTVITITTVGFREVVELGPGGQLLTIGLIGGGVVTVTYAAFTSAEYVVEGHLRHDLERRRMDKRIRALHGHTIVCGYGRVGRHLSATLARDGAPLVVVDTTTTSSRRWTSTGSCTSVGTPPRSTCCRRPGSTVPPPWSPA